MNQQVELVVRRPGQPERRMVLAPGVTHLGRAEDNDLVLPDIGVSRRHARILVDHDGVVVEDMGSGNGTYVGGRRVEAHRVQDGDEVLVDPFVLSFQVRPLAEPPRPEPDTARVASAPPQGMANARLVVLSGQRLASSYPLISEPLIMGRSEGREIVLFDPAASRKHCRVERRGSRWWLVDMDSANGTYVAGERVRELALSSGDRIRIGSTEFRFEVLDAPTSMPVPMAVPSSPPPVARPTVAGPVPGPAPAPAQPAPAPAPRNIEIRSAAVSSPPPKQTSLFVRLLPMLLLLALLALLFLLTIIAALAAYFYFYVGAGAAVSSLGLAPGAFALACFL